VLLNNDTVVTKNWLAQLIALAETTPTIGAVGPMSNYAAPPQLVECVPYRIGPKKAGRLEGRHGASAALVDVEAVNQFALEMQEKHRGKCEGAERLGGFCMLIKREALLRIGPLDPWTDLSLFDSDILSSKARQAGYQLACCKDVFIHHFGVRTFAHGAPAKEERRDAAGIVR